MSQHPRQTSYTGNLFTLQEASLPRAFIRESFDYVSALGVQLWISCMGRHPYASHKYYTLFFLQ
jgi:hypothetical protein